MRTSIARSGKSVAAAQGLAAAGFREGSTATSTSTKAVDHRVPESFYRRFGKRALDVSLGALLLLLFSPLMLAAALGVLMTAGWPIFYRAKRVGRGGRVFHMLKFRTMVRDADAALVMLLRSDGALAQEYTSAFKLRNDPRTTPLGAFLRKYSIDELPQLWHVVTGEMSLVGPRPYAATEAELDLVSAHPEILEQKPALTGPWQVQGRNDLTPAERIEKDRAYARGVTLRRDLTYLLATVKCLVCANGR